MFDESTVDINVLPTTFAPVLEAERSNEACSGSLDSPTLRMNHL